ncbi:glycoside hydrolase family 32 protein [Paenibacillus puerhi]|uniref:glycoside hydrolase family 32 protein n=1 Tax=Paenibacillus puerhi TaxID=2692622 RepID=UPI001358985E|nr:glycoside hydrolase family 32 protein [Paenibacillus puerhi]
METKPMDKKIDHGTVIQRANEAIEKNTDMVKKSQYRLGYHYMAPAGWLNDPNGLIQFKGEYHMFYQHHPYSSDWGPMHWGHAKSKDLVNWENLPIALAPSEDYDIGGVFSGSAIDLDGILTLYYTGHVDEKTPKEVQCVATSTDGIHFEKHTANPIIDYPPVDGSFDFRDPKVWKHEDIWYMVISTGKEGIGKAVLYKSEDGFKWDYIGVVAQSDGTLGEIWECADLFPLGRGRSHALITSLMGPEIERCKILLGEMDYAAGQFNWKHVETMDYGFDYYAPQTFIDNQGRRIAIGWMDIWGAEFLTKPDGWCGAMALPRVIDLSAEGEVRYLPVVELEQLREQHIAFRDVGRTFGGSNPLEEVKGSQLEIKAVFDPAACSAQRFGLKVRCSEDGTQGTRITYDMQAKKLSVDRSLAGLGAGGICTAPLELTAGQKLDLHIYIDTTSIEVFANGGRIVFSNRIYPDVTSNGVELLGLDGHVKVESLDIWTLRSV